MADVNSLMMALAMKPVGGDPKASGGYIGVNGPIGPLAYLSSYFASEKFRQRNRAMNPSDKASEIEKDAAEALAHNKVVINKQDYSYAKPTMQGAAQAGYSINLSSKEANQLKTSLYNDILPHEFGHWMRKSLTDDELEMIAERNQARQDKSGNSVAMKLFQGYKEAKDKNSNLTYTSFLNKIGGGHDLSSTEAYADLTALRYAMYKAGVYDARKGDVTPEQIEKFYKDEKYKKYRGHGVERLGRFFKHEHIAELNNKIAMNDNPVKNTVA